MVPDINVMFLSPEGKMVPVYLSYPPQHLYHIIFEFISRGVENERAMALETCGENCGGVEKKNIMLFPSYLLNFIAVLQ